VQHHCQQLLALLALLLLILSSSFHMAAQPVLEEKMQQLHQKHLVAYMAFFQLLSTRLQYCPAFLLPLLPLLLLLPEL
jgi:hypothetical protein